MPRITPAEELNLIESIVAAHHGGIGIAEIEQAMAQRQGDAWMTVVGDVPAVTLRAFLDGLSRRQ